MADLHSDPLFSPHPQSPSGTDFAFYNYGDFPAQSSPLEYAANVKEMSPMTRSRLATWTYSPDSGYTESAAASDMASVSSVASTRGAKRRANSLESSTGHSDSPLLGADNAVDTELDVDFDSVKVERELCEPAVDTFVYPSRVDSTELVVLRQPEARHRPRYQTEGSRGRIKDRSGSSSPAVQLKNFHGRSAILQVYVALEEGVPRPHPLFKICKVNNKVAAPAIVRELWNNIAVLEMAFSEKRDWTIDVDCISLMKLRNVDCEEVLKPGDPLKRVRTRRGTGGSPRIRLAFRAILTMTNGSKETLQVTSSPISCCSSLGMPEINFVSHRSCPATGGTEVVVLGRSFVKNDSKLLVVEKSMEDELIWENEAKQLTDKFNQVHIVATLPPYRNVRITNAVPVYLCVRNADGKQSDLFSFTYTAVAGSSPPPPPPPPPVEEYTRRTSQPVLSRGASRDQPPPEKPQSRRPSGEVNTPVTPGPLASPFGSTHYCIELPGMTQPIIITIPRSAESSTSSDGAAYTSNDLSTSMQSQPTTTSTPLSPIGVRPSVAIPVVTQQQTAVSTEQQAGAPDEYDTSKAFDDLLREILGPETSDSSDPLLNQNMPADESWMLEVESQPFSLDDDYNPPRPDPYSRDFPPS